MRSNLLKGTEKAFDRGRLSDLLFYGMQGLPLQLNQKQFNQLLDYLALLHKWNGVYNLTAVRNAETMVQQHLLDSLAAVSAFDQSRHVLDVGSGGGLPGVILAIARPDMKVELIDAVQKKTAFLRQVKGNLELNNVEVHSGRVENLRVDQLFDTITSRAFSSLGEMIQLSHHLLSRTGQYIAMKGVMPNDEMKELPSGWEVDEVRSVNVPGMKAERHLVFIKREKP